MPAGTVVAAAIIRDGQVLAARRRRPAEVRGGWEFPGGKVERGETDASALARECAEELGVRIKAGPLLATAMISSAWQLRVYRATLREGEPRPGADHDELRWLGPDELTEPATMPGTGEPDGPAGLDAPVGLAWLPADAACLAVVRQALAGPLSLD